MSRVYFRNDLEGVATFWRIYRRDGVALAFTSHNRDLNFAGHRHRAAPGMLPSAIRRTAAIDYDSVDVQGVLSHDSISAKHLRAGCFDSARIAIGIVDWETLEYSSLFHGELGEIREDSGRFEAQLQSAKASLGIDLVPRTSPTCRAQFCDAKCGLNPAQFTHLATVTSVDSETGRVDLAGSPGAQSMLHGSLRWLGGPHAGQTMRVIDAQTGSLVVDRQLDAFNAGAEKVMLREGCDHTLSTCEGRFNNSLNFRGEPFLPGNDLLARYPSAST